MSFTDISVATQAATIISQKQFSSYTQAWVQAASTGDHLVEAFEKTGYERLTYASFDFQTIVWLVSTVGTRRIKAQFVLVPAGHSADGTHSPAHFSIVLYAVDAMNGRISAYYLGSNAFTPKIEQAGATTDFESSQNPAQTANVSDSNEGAPVAFDLVKIWLTNWASPEQHISRDLFTSNYGPLQGYTFDLGDFMDPLFYSQKFGRGQVLHVGFGLHEYHAAFAKHGEHSLTRTFGLVLRFYDNPTSTANSDSKQAVFTAGEPGQPFYDLSTPNPPGSYESN